MNYNAICVARADKRRRVVSRVNKLPIPFKSRLELLGFLCEPGRALSMPATTLA